MNLLDTDNATVLGKRRSARILVVDAIGRLLLVRDVAPNGESGLDGWTTPDGEIGPDGDELAAARRVLRDVLGLSYPLIGPIPMPRRKGETDARHDPFYLVRFPGGSITSRVDACGRDVRWWSALQIENSAERVYPGDLPELLRSIRVRPRIVN